MLDLWRESLPEIDDRLIAAKDAVQRGASFTDEQSAAWAAISRMAVRFSLADRVLISTPMWNFGLPYKLKHYIDLINQPRLTFRFDPAAGYVPLLKDRPTLAIVSSGGDFVTGSNRGRIDMATPLPARGAALHGRAQPRSCAARADGRRQTRRRRRIGRSGGWRRWPARF